MATKTLNLSSGIWRKITAANESGTCWITAISGSNRMLVNHTITPQGDTITVGSQEELDAGLDNHDNAFPLTIKDKVIDIPADSIDDVYYALFIATRPAASNIAKITTDVC